LNFWVTAFTGSLEFDESDEGFLNGDCIISLVLRSLTDDSPTGTTLPEGS